MSTFMFTQLGGLFDRETRSLLRCSGGRNRAQATTLRSLPLPAPTPAAFVPASVRVKIPSPTL